MRNASLPATCVLALLMALPTAWSQSATGSVPKPLLPDHRIPAIMQHLNDRGAVPMASRAELPAKSTYKISVVDFPGVASSEAHDTYNGTIVGAFIDDQNQEAPTGFTMKANVAQLFTIQGFNGIPTIYAMSSSGEMVGLFIVPQIGGRSFEIVNGQATIFDPPDSTFDQALGVNAAGSIVGIYLDPNSVLHGYLYGGGQFTTIDYPGSKASSAYDINATGEIVGSWTDSNNQAHGYILTGGTFTSFDFPQATGTNPTGLNDKGDISGSYTDAANMAHGFLYSKGVFQTIDVPRALGTVVFRVKNNGELLGWYADDKYSSHGFTAQ